MTFKQPRVKARDSAGSNRDASIRWSLRRQIDELKLQLDDLVAERNGIDQRIQLINSALGSLVEAYNSTDPGSLVLWESDEARAGGETRMKRDVGRTLRTDAAKTIVSHMLCAEGRAGGDRRRCEFTRAELESLISPALKHHWQKIVDEHNAAHPDRPILHNGLGRNKRRYYLGPIK